jgi:hypothetical protein
VTDHITGTPFVGHSADIEKGFYLVGLVENEDELVIYDYFSVAAECSDD